MTMTYYTTKDLQSAVTLISGILVLFGTSGLGGMALIFFRLGQSRQATITTLESIISRLQPLESWREKRGVYVTKPDCEKEHEEFGRRIDDKFIRFIDDIDELKADRKIMLEDIAELKVMLSECLTEIRVRNER